MVTEQSTFSIGGMTCGSCVARIEKALRDREGVIWASVNFAAQQAVVTYDPGAVAPRQLADVIEHLGYEATRRKDGESSGVRAAEMAKAGLRPETASPLLPVLAGLVSAGLLAGFYLAAVTIAMDWKQATELLWGDRWLVGVIAAGFGLQIGLFVYLHRLNVLHHRSGQCKVLTGAGTGTSSLAMLACCAHHLTDVLPVLGLSAAATFLNQYRIPFMLVGLGANLVGIVVMLRLVHAAHVRIQSRQLVQGAACH